MKHIVAIVYLLAALFISLKVHADTVILKDKPGNVITAADAAKAPRTFKCDEIHRGPNINPVKVPGSKTIWSSDPGKGVDDVAGLLDNNATGYRCKSVALDKATGRMKSAE